jgi:sterol desaturase/sphingolipid hydroxylase (fatty acid hydroxylase superfamily)
VKRLLRRVLDAEVPSIQATSLGARVLLIVPLLLLSAQITYDTAFRASSQSWEAVEAVARSFTNGVLPETMFSSAVVASFFGSSFGSVLAVSIALCLAIRFGVVFLGPILYERSVKKPLPIQFALVMVSLNLVLMLVALGVLSGAAAVARGAGFEFQNGAELIDYVVKSLNGAIDRHVPNLVTIPYPLPLLAAEIPAGLGYYWFHRLQHTWRPLWLFTHRAHHITTHLTSVTTAPANDPLGFFLAPLAEGLLVGTATKLFGSEPMVAEATLLALFTYTASEVFNHNEPTYWWTIRGPVRRVWFNFTGWGAYHLMHHSAAEEHRLANIGGGPFMLWDRVFGTYFTPTEKKPDMGLTGRPTLWMNPLRLALASYLEVASDLRRNSAWRDRLKILFGSTRYVPPVHASDLVKRDARAAARTASSSGRLDTARVPNALGTGPSVPVEGCP